MPSLASHERKHRAVWSCFYYGELIPTPTCFDWIISFFPPPDAPNTALYLCCVFLTNAQRPCNRVWFSAVFLVFVTLSTTPSLEVSLPLTSTNMHFSGFSAFLKTAFLCPLLSRSFPHPLKANFLSPVHSPLCFRWSTLLSLTTNSMGGLPSNLHLQLTPPFWAPVSSSAACCSFPFGYPNYELLMSKIELLLFLSKPTSLISINRAIILLVDQTQNQSCPSPPHAHLVTMSWVRVLN